MSFKTKYVHFVCVFLFFLCSCAKSAQEVSVVEKVSSAKTKVRLAVVTVPVADGIGMRPTSRELNKNRFSTLPCSYPSNFGYTKLRIHQVLYNQVVKLLEVRGRECRIELPNVVVQNALDKPPKLLSLWVQKDHIILFEHLKSHDVAVENIPFPLQEKTKQRIATLRFPYTIASHKRSYSSGTRFVVRGEKNGELIVWTLNPQSMKGELVSIPKNICLINDSKSKRQKLADYVKLLRLWSNLEGGFIPYVLGGASWINTCGTSNQITSYALKDDRGKPIVNFDKPCYVYDRKKMPKGAKTGYDCSSLIYSAAQTAGIPYYGKNTVTALNQLKKAKRGDKLENGDIIWVPGHVFIITDVEERLKISQARGYSGQGKVYEEKGSILFQGASTAKKLLSDYLAGKPLVRLKNIKVDTTFKNWHILKIKSAWSTPLVVRRDTAISNFKRDINRARL